MFSAIYSFCIRFINAIIRGLGKCLSFVLALLPDSPFQKFFDNYLDTVNGYLGFINYFCPISEACAILEAVCIAVAVYYLYQIVLRWVKAIE